MVWTVWEGLSWDVWGWGGPSPLVGGWMLPALRANLPPPSEVALGGCAGGILRGAKHYHFGSSPLRTSLAVSRIAGALS